MSNKNFRYQPFVAVSGNLGGKVPIVDHVLSSHEQEIYPTTSLDENCIEYEFQADRNYYVDLRQFFGIEAQICQRTWLRHMREYWKEKGAQRRICCFQWNKNRWQKEGEEVARFTYVNNILHSIFSNVEVYINNQQTYNSNGLYAHKSYISNNFKAAISEYKGFWFVKAMILNRILRILITP